MTKSARTVAVIVISAVVLLFGVLIARDILLRRAPTVRCSDGSHPGIDLRDFTTQNWAYSLKLEASVASKAQLSTELDPKTLEQVSEALQEGREFRKYVVAGYNSCAVTQAQYAQFETRFRALDSLAREADVLLSRPALTREESTQLAEVVRQYGALAKQLGSQ